jgi:hypothetical protein
MRIVIITTGREISRYFERPSVGLSDYLLIRLITVFDPALAGSFFAREKVRDSLAN